MPVKVPRRLALVSALAVPAVLLVGYGGPASARVSGGATSARTPRTHPVTLGTYTPTFTGSAATGCASGCDLLAGPYSVPAASSSPAKPSSIASLPDTARPMPLLRAGKSARSGVTIPNISCSPQGAGCDTISTSSGGAVGVKGLNAVDSATSVAKRLYKIVEPPDQGMCAGGGYVVEDNNIGEALIFNEALKRVSPVISLDTIMGLQKRGWSSGGDPSCLYDYANGGHWIYTEIVSKTPEAKGGAFIGCFAAVAKDCLEGIAVSKGSSPFGPFNVYFLNANYNPNEPGYPYLLNDFAKIAVSRDAFLMFYDEFPLLGGGIGGGFFNGAQEFAFNKTGLEEGWPVSKITVAQENMGLIPTPNGTCASDNKYHEPGVTCWYSVIPAMPPDPSQYDNSYGGSAFMLNTLDNFYNTGNNRLAVWAWTDLGTLNSSNCSACSGIRFSGEMFPHVLHYYDNNSLPSGMLAPQKTGPIPLGNACRKAGLSRRGHCPENGIATNGDNITQASQAQGKLWASASTEVNQTFAGGAAETHMGAVYWVVGLAGWDTSQVFTLASEGYVSPMHEDLSMPAMAAAGSSAADGGNNGAIIVFTLTGTGGPYLADSGGFYPSTAYGRLTSTSGTLTGHVINIADMGQSPQDGFSEYQNYGAGTVRPRWGDYSAGVYDTHSGKIYFANNYIQYPNCWGSAFNPNALVTCNGTRTGLANWGTSVNYVTP